MTIAELEKFVTRTEEYLDKLDRDSYFCMISDGEKPSVYQ